jgi:hypothetical protein
VTAFLVDGMFPPTAAVLLREKYGHDAVHVSELGLAGADDAQVAAAAGAQDRAVVTENVADFATEREVVLLSYFRRTSPQAARKHLRWRRSWTAGRTSTRSPALAPTGRGHSKR